MRPLIPGRQAERRGLRLWNVGIVLFSTVLGALVVAGATFYLGWHLLGAHHLKKQPLIDSSTLFELVKLAFGVVAGAGALVALVVAYRRQRVDEDAALRDATRLHNERFTSAVAQLGDDRPTVRLGGVHALAGLADDAPTRQLRQTCIDVLCAFLRLPYTAETELPADDAGARHAYLELREARHTVIRLIRDHLRLKAHDPRSWQGHNFDFTHTVFDGGDFSGVIFSGGIANFAAATFAGDTDFSRSEFSGGEVNFTLAKFEKGDIFFTDSKFNGCRVTFGSAKISGAELNFDRTLLHDGLIDFGYTYITDGSLSFNRSSFVAGSLRFDSATFLGGHILFIKTIFAGTLATFNYTQFLGASAYFNGSQFAGGEIGFVESRFEGGSVAFSRTTFCGSSVTFSAQFSEGRVSFTQPLFTNGTVDFGAASGHAPHGLREAIGSPPAPGVTLAPGW